MSKYTTGEMAKLCKVSVRTVQYYDTRGILIPGELSEGGRRLYTDEDLQKLKIICFLRSIDFSIDNIGTLLKEENPYKVISLLMEQQENTLHEEIRERQEKLNTISGVRSALKNIENFSVESIGDIVKIMENKKRLRKIRGIMLAVAIPLEIIETGAFILGCIKGIWLPFAVIFPVVFGLAMLLTKFYYDNIAYICPECHNCFRPSFMKVLFSAHTPNTRKLSCPECGKTSFCVETCREEGEKNA